MYMKYGYIFFMSWWVVTYIAYCILHHMGATFGANMEPIWSHMGVNHYEYMYISA